MGDGGDRSPLEGQKIFLNVSENISGDRKLIFIFLVFTEKNAFDIRQNA